MAPAVTPAVACLGFGLDTRVTVGLFLMCSSLQRGDEEEMSNPYEAPDTRSSIAVDVDAETRIVISGQKQLLYSILGYFGCMPLLIFANVFLGGTSANPVVTPMFGVVLAAGLLGFFAASISACMGIFRMGGILFPGSTRYLYSIGVLIPAPLIGLIVMFVANSSASSYLKARGYKIGLLGARIQQAAG